MFLHVFRVPEGDDLAEAVKTAIAKGYRSIDTEQVYRNEESVGRGIRAAIDEGLVTREELFVTSKVWNDGLSSTNGISRPLFNVMLPTFQHSYPYWLYIKCSGVFVRNKY